MKPVGKSGGKERKMEGEYHQCTLIYVCKQNYDNEKGELRKSNSNGIFDQRHYICEWKYHNETLL
jgi:hypothetical protein